MIVKLSTNSPIFGIRTKLWKYAKSKFIYPIDLDSCNEFIIPTINRRRSLHTFDKPCNLYAEMFPVNINLWPSPKN